MKTNPPRGDLARNYEIYHLNIDLDTPDAFGSGI